MRPNYTAHNRATSLQSGFTLVELLVVIGIIAILAGVALGPITQGIQKAKQSSATQQAHALGLAMYSAANDNNQLFPDTTGASSDKIAAILLAGGYVTDPTIFYLSGDTAASKLTSSNNTAANFNSGNGVTCWDFLGNGGNGVSSTAYPFLPILWTTVNAGSQFTVTTSPNVAMTATAVAANPFGTSGVAVFYINNAAAFVTATNPAVAGQVTMVTGSNNLGSAPTTYIAIPGK